MIRVLPLGLHQADEANLSRQPPHTGEWSLSAPPYQMCITMRLTDVLFTQSEVVGRISIGSVAPLFSFVWKQFLAITDFGNNLSRLLMSYH